MIIDTHVHLVALNDEHGCYVSPKMSSGLVYHMLSTVLGMRGVPRDQLDDVYRERLVGWAEDSDLDGVGLLGLDGVYDAHGELDGRTHVMVANDYVFEVCRDSDKLLPIPSVNPQRKDALAELDRVSQLGAVAIKVLPNSQGFDPSRRDYQPFWRRMAELELPLLTHTSFEHTIPVIEQTHGRPERLIPVLDAGVTVIAAHCASAGVAHIHEDFGMWQRMLRDYPNLYGDISAMASAARFPYIRRVLDDPLACQRALLGSDFPIPVSPWLFAPRIGLRRAFELKAMDNPLQKNLDTFRAVGVGEAILRRASKVLRL